MRRSQVEEAGFSGVREREDGYEVDASDEGLVDSLIPVLAGHAATRVVREAASVLEEELAAGLQAARRMEERFIDVQAIRSRSPDHVMQRFRADAHEVVDILFDIFTVATDSAANVVERAFVIGGDKVKGRRVSTSFARSSGRPAASPAAYEPRDEEPSLPTLAPPVPIMPGQTVELAIAVENPSDAPTKPVAFGCADLVSAEGEVLEAVHIVCIPSPVVLPPRSIERIAIRIHVPRGTRGGSYRGMFWADNLPAVRAMLAVPVADVVEE